MQPPSTTAKPDWTSAGEVFPNYKPTHHIPLSLSVHEEGLAAFLQVRPRLFGIACRMLNSAAEAEDLVQDVWLRWQRADRSQVVEPAAFLTTITTRLAINELESARVRREWYVGTSIPERADMRADPYRGVERAEALELAVLLLMQRLKPKERAAYILREAFEYPYGKIAEVVQSTESNSRQLVSRARRRINSGHKTAVCTHEEPALLATFIDAAQVGSAAALEEVLLISPQRARAA